MDKHKHMLIAADVMQNINDLQRRFPVVGDKALIDLGNGIQVSGDIILFRKRMGVVARLLEKISNRGVRRELLVEENLNAGQEALWHWALGLTDSMRVSQLALRITQKSLLEARAAIREHAERLRRQSAVSLELMRQVEDLAAHVDSRVGELDSRLKTLEWRVAARDDFDRITSAWAAGQTYTGMHWVVQVALLAREVFSSCVGMFEAGASDGARFRELLVNKVMAESKKLPDSWFNLSDLLDQSWEAMPGQERQLAADLLEVRSWPIQRLLNAPHLFTLGTTFEIATLPREALPPSPSRCAIEICRTRISHLASTTDKREFATNLVNETAEDCSALMRSAIT